MFYITERIKGVPGHLPGLMFGADNVYEYWIAGCETTVEKVDRDYGYRPIETADWRHSGRNNSVASFIKQIQTISKREGFYFLQKSFYDQ